MVIIDIFVLQVLQELCAWVGAAEEGALFALHRLAKAARARSADRDNQ